MNLPQIEPITSITKDQESVLAKLDNGPVFLVQRSRPVAVLLSVQEYERMARRFERLELASEARRVSSRLKSGHDETTSHDDLTRHILESRVYATWTDLAD